MSATVVVTIPLTTLQGGLAAATLDEGTPLSPGEARRIACDAGLIPAVLGTASEVLDLGRTARLFSRPQRLAMAIRQQHTCAARGCQRPAAWRASGGPGSRPARSRGADMGLGSVAEAASIGILPPGTMRRPRRGRAAGTRSPP